MIGQSAPQIITIPSSDAAFRQHVERLRSGPGAGRPDQLESRLRRLFPRIIVRERALSGEPPAWYVYRDGGWQPSVMGPWWLGTGVPRVTVSSEGWITEANSTARSLFGVQASDVGSRHFTDFVAPGTLDDSVALFGIIESGHDLTATVLLRPTSGDVVAVDLHAAREGPVINAQFRLADDVEVQVQGALAALPELVCLPQSDVAFRGYADLALSRMPEPTPDMLAMRLRRLYPHARVAVDGDRWIATRESAAADTTATGWWRDASLPLVRYDSEALILEANDAAQALLGSRLIGHHWQEFVTPGSTEQVSAMLAILAEVGAAESRFRMPGADGALVEFDSYTEVDGETFTTVMRPRA
jgi:PAS domain-containing protein